MFEKEYFICDICRCESHILNICNIDEYVPNDSDNESDCDSSTSSDSVSLYKEYECRTHETCFLCYDEYQCLNECPLCLHDKLLKEYMNNLNN